MRHKATKSLYRYWRELLRTDAYGSPVWPDRSEITPAAMRDWLGDVFILEAAGEGDDVTYRLAGTRVCELFGRELARQPFSFAFEGADRAMARSWIATFGREGTPLLFASEATTTTGGTCALETLVLPLGNREAPEQKRAVGLTVVCDRPHWQSAAPVSRQSLLGVRVLRPWEQGLAKRDWPVMRPSAGGRMIRMERRGHAAGRRIGHLTVLQGGRA